MRTWIVASMLGIGALTACAPREQTPDERVLLDETVPLIRQTTSDVATRELEVDSDSVVVAIVDEKLADVHVTLATNGSGRGADTSVFVENNLAGGVPALDHAIASLDDPNRRYTKGESPAQALGSFRQ